MMKKLFVLLLICVIGNQLSSQSVAINNNGTAPDPSSMLDISSNAKGILVPRMNTSERTAIANPALGLLVFDTDTRTFWFFSNTWNEIGTGGNGSQNGLAGGDLSGSYPTPNVVKLQNLDLAPGVPFDKQVLKWDMQANTWKGMNDSLFLPYTASAGSASKLFWITNNTTTNGATAIYGRSGNTGSGITPALSIGVWGDNSTGAGILGTSTNGVGTYGFSTGNYGLYGFSSGNNMAGVYGSHANTNGTAVMGEMYNGGIGLYGKVIGTAGKAGLFESKTGGHWDTTFKVTTAGIGSLGVFQVQNNTSTNPALEIVHQGEGNGLKVQLTKSDAVATAVNILNAGHGRGLDITSEKGVAAFFTITNPASLNNVLAITNYGMGSAINAVQEKTTEAYPIAEFTHKGIGKGLRVVQTNPSNGYPAIDVSTSGNIGAIIDVAGSNGIVALAGSIGVTGYSGPNATNGMGVYGKSGDNGSGGIGVMGLAGANDLTGIGVKGVSSSPSQLHGAVTAINTTNGIGVFGQAAGNDGISMYGRAGNGNSQTKAAVFENINAGNTRPVVEVITNGAGNALSVNATKVANTSPVLELKNAGTGNFLLLEDGNAAAVTSVTKAGNIYTNGTVSVKGNKGTLRNSFANHLRYETAQAVFDDGSGGTVTLCNECSMTRTINFTETFDTAPTVTVGNLAPGFVDIPYKFQVSVTQVSTTGFTIMIYNGTGSSRTFKATWKLAVIGNDD